MKCVLCNKKKFTILFSHYRNLRMGKCASCGLVQVVPMPSSKEIAKLYHEDFDHFTPYLEQLSVHHAYFKQKIKEIIGRLSKQSTKKRRLLDIGCAMGVIIEEAKKKDIRAVGIDLSHDAVSYCRKQGMTVHEGTIQSLGSTLKPHSFDVVTAFQVIEHERDPLTMMRRIRALTCKGGLVVLATPNYGGFWRKLMGKRWVGFTHPEHVVLFDHVTMKQLLHKAGFWDIEVKNDTSRPFPLSFAFKRGADYFPWLAWVLKPMGTLLDRFDIKNPINPWDDMIAFARA